MSIRHITPNITTFSVPFSRLGLIKFGGRGTLTRLQSGGLLIFSPVALTSEVRSEVQAMGGNVSYIVAPDMEHHLYIGAWKKEFPAARVIAPQGLREKRAKQGNEDVAVDYAYTKEGVQLPADLTQTFDVEYWDGHVNKEIAFFHKPERTLIAADVMFNMPATEQYSKTSENASSGFFTKLFVHFSTIEGKDQQRLIWHGMAKDKVSFAESAKRVAGWDFDRIIPCHGDVIEHGGNDVFRRLFAWHIGGK